MIAFGVLILFLSVFMLIIRKYGASIKTTEAEDKTYLLNFCIFGCVLISPLVFSILVMLLASLAQNISLLPFPYSLGNTILFIGRLILLTALPAAFHFLKSPSSRTQELAQGFVLGWYVAAAQHFLFIIR